MSGEAGAAGTPFRFDDDAPFDPATDDAQRAGLRRLLDPAPRRVLDLGCGAGRTLVSLAEAGHDVIGIDMRGDALDRCRAELDAKGIGAELRQGDFRDDWPPDAGDLDAVLCLGNTFMLLSDPDDAVDLLVRCGNALRDGGVVVIDDIPRDLWPEVTEGNWVSGLTEDGTLQLVWAAGDTVFALRSGGDIDPLREHPGEEDRPCRLWTDGALRLAARCASLSAPVRHDGEHLLVMQRRPR